MDPNLIAEAMVAARTIAERERFPADHSASARRRKKDVGGRSSSGAASSFGVILSATDEGQSLTTETTSVSV